MGVLPVGIKIKERTGIKGLIKITSYDVITKKTEVFTYHNLITSAGLNALARAICQTGSKTNEGIPTFLAVGTDDTAADVGDVALGTEIFRKSLVLKTATAGAAALECFLLTTEGNGAIKELGVFGEDATVTADSGTLFNRSIIDLTKTSSKEWTISITWTLANA